MKKTFTLFVLALAAMTACAFAQTATLSVDAGADGVPLNPRMYGIFFEEINHSGDGGIYAELIENRSFEDYRLPEGTAIRGENAVGPNKGWRVKFDSTNKFPHWEFSANNLEAYLTLGTESPIHPNNLSYACVTIGTVLPNGKAVLSNDGYWGIAVKKGEQYKFSIFARAAQKTPVQVRLIGKDNAVLGETSVEIASDKWTKYESVIVGEDDAADAKLELTFTQPGKVFIDEVSLFPPTWNDRPNGLRKDLVQKLYDLKPGFVRFPGGCIVEGCTLANRFQPTTTLGPVETRPSRWILWNYRSPQGLGLHEYYQLCEDIGAEAMLVVNCGMTCEFRDGGMVSDDDLQPYIDDALNSIEYALGPVTSKYGAMRAAAGHPEPFNLKYVEIGNENWGNEYRPRYKVFQAALKAKYPNLEYVSCIEIGDADVDYRDDHYYNSPAFFRSLNKRYDKEARTGRKIYVGEYGVTQGVGHGNLDGALGEAAMMIGMERNADLVTMASFAPLFYHINDQRWAVNLIGFDNSRCFGQPSYYVQKMFSTQKGDRVLPTELTIKSPESAKPACTVAMATWNTKAEFKDVVVTDASGKEFKLDAQQEKALFAPLAEQNRMPNMVVVPNLKLGDSYTLKFKARKLDGREGFLIGINYYDDQNFTWINRGGWENTRDSIEETRSGDKAALNSQIGAFKPIQTGVWYEYEIQVGKNSLVAFENGKQFIKSNLGAAASDVFAIAHRDTKTGELLIRIVNAKAEPIDVQIELKNLTGKTAFTVEETVLTSEKVTDRNTCDEPEKVAPKTSTFTASGTAFTYKAKANSLTILRLK